MSKNISSKTLDKLWSCLNNEALDPIFFRKFFLLATRAHYEDENNLGPVFGPALCKARYNDDSDKDGMPIELTDVFDPERADTTWGIFVHLGRQTMARQVVGNVADRAADNGKSSVSFDTVTQLSILHMADTADAALLMATCTLTFFTAIGPAIVARLQNRGMRSFTPLGSGDVQRKGKSGNRSFLVAVDFQINYNFMSQLNLEGHRIKKLILHNEAALAHG